MNDLTHPADRIPQVGDGIDERAEAHAAIDATLAILDIALADKNADLFVECDLHLCQINADLFEELEPRT